MPYDFGYEVRDLEGNEQYRNEQSDGNRVTGSYGKSISVNFWTFFFLKSSF